LGNKYDQQSIVYGEKNETGGMNFYLIECSTGEVWGTRKVFVNLDNPSDNYSEVSGIRFVIPFATIDEFIKDQEGKDLMVNGKRQFRKRDYSDSDWDGGRTSPSNVTTIDVDEMLNEQLEELQTKALSTMGSTSWNYRGKLRDTIWKMNK
jgi:hypothetical protein